jgi:hypothetical protein
VYAVLWFDIDDEPVVAGISAAEVMYLYPESLKITVVRSNIYAKIVTAPSSFWSV